MRRAAGITIVVRLLAFALTVCVLTGCSYYKHRHELVLRDDLFTLRSAIDQYTIDKAQAPQVLDDLVKAGYLREVPRDPMTGKADWLVVPCETYMSIDQSQTGVCDVHSAAGGSGTDGTPYGSW